jgi:uncharacterized membrane protein
VFAQEKPPTPPRSRLDSVDLLRGLVMTLMALDHTRGFFTNVHFDPLDLTQTTIPLFLTRWITSICAPVFFSLAGTGAFLWQARGKTKRELSRFLVTRGLWLVLLDITFTSWFGWKFNFSSHQIYSVVLWALGWSMVVLGGLIWLPLWVITTFSLVMIVLHDLLDRVAPDSLGRWNGLWRILHAGGNFDLFAGVKLEIIYPLIPWIGVMSLGYCFGTILLRAPADRQKWITRAGLTIIIMFVTLRWTNLYGDPVPWTSQKNLVLTLLSFLKCAKYPPSLCFLLMTLGPALLLLALFDKHVPIPLQPLLVFGRAPMFFYLLHLPLIHILAIAVNLFRFGRADWLYGPQPTTIPPPANAGFGLAGVYLFTFIVLVLLYFAGERFSKFKLRSRASWLSYL